MVQIPLLIVALLLSFRIRWAAVEWRRAEDPDVAELLRFPRRFDEGDERVVVAEVFAQDQADLRVFAAASRSSSGMSWRRSSPKWRK